MKAFSLIFIFSLTAGLTYASQNDYHPVTGEPKCMDCHTPDRRYSIDYTREDSCGECHDPVFSNKYTAIDIRYKTEARGEKQESTVKTAEVKSKKSEVENAPKDMVLIPAGEFTMGSNDWWPKSGPEHKKSVNAFYIDKYEVTNNKYKTFVDSAGYNPPDNWKDNRIPAGRENHPVVYVSWFDAEAYCRWTGKRLPTEEEWEKAARGTDGRIYPWGDKFDSKNINSVEAAKDGPVKVGTFEKGKSPYGVYDMAGNVSEWTDSWDNKKQYRITRGGSYFDGADLNKTTSTLMSIPVDVHEYIGFRCVKSK